MAYCVKCGEKVMDGIRFCPECGAEIPLLNHADTKADAGDTGRTDEYTYGNQTDAGQQNDAFHPYQDYGPADGGQGSYAQSSYVQNGEEYFNPDDVRANKVMGVLAYIGILVIVPLFARNKNSEYARFHTNQGLVLFLAEIIIDLITGGEFLGFHSILYFDWWLTDVIGSVCSLAFFVMWIMGIVSACKGTKKELPIIGKIKILK